MIAVVGPGASADATLVAAAEQVGRLLAAAGQQVVTGGLDGVMAAASRGAATAGGTVVALLPGLDPAAANPDASVVVPTGLGEARNAVVVRSAAGIVAVGGSWGTLSEVALAMRTGKPVVWLHPWRIDGPDEPVPTAASPQEAVERILAAVS